MRASFLWQLLDIGDLETYIEQSQVIMIFATSGYFKSKSP